MKERCRFVRPGLGGIAIILILGKQGRKEGFGLESLSIQPVAVLCEIYNCP
jgi:hypothetical protein